MWEVRAHFEASQTQRDVAARRKTALVTKNNDGVKHYACTKCKGNWKESVETTKASCPLRRLACVEVGSNGAQ